MPICRIRARLHFATTLSRIQTSPSSQSFSTDPHYLIVSAVRLFPMTKRMIGPFEVGSRIGIGGMGIVYRATYVKSGAQVALKILSPELSETESLQRRFEREVSILKKLQIPTSCAITVVASLEHSDFMRWSSSRAGRSKIT